MPLLNPEVEYYPSPGIITIPLIILSVFLIRFAHLIFTSYCVRDKNVDVDLGAECDDEDNKDKQRPGNGDNEISSVRNSVNDDRGEVDGQSRGMRNMMRESASSSSSYSSVCTQVARNRVESHQRSLSHRQSRRNNTSNNSNIVEEQNSSNENKYPLPRPIPQKLSAFLNWCRRMRILNVTHGNLGIILLVLLSQSPPRYLFQECFDNQNPVIQNSSLLVITPWTVLNRAPFFSFCYSFPKDHNHPSCSNSENKFSLQCGRVPLNFTQSTHILEVVDHNNNGENNTNNSVVVSGESILKARPNCPFFVQNVSNENTMEADNYYYYPSAWSSSSSISLYVTRCNSDAYLYPPFPPGITDDDSDIIYNKFETISVIIMSKFGNVPPSWYFLPFGTDDAKNQEYYDSLSSKHSDYFYEWNIAFVWVAVISGMACWGCELFLIICRFVAVVFFVDKEKRKAYDWTLILPGFSLFVFLIRPIPAMKYFGMKTRKAKNTTVATPSSPLVVESTNTTTMPDEQDHQDENLESIPGELSFELMDFGLSNFLISLFNISFFVFCISYLISAVNYGWLLAPAHSDGIAVGLAFGMTFVTFQFCVTFLPGMIHFFDFLFNRGPKLIKRTFFLEFLPSVQKLPFDTTFEKIKKIYAITAIPRRGIALATTCVRIVYATLLLIGYLHLYWLARDPNKKWAFAAQILSYFVIACEFFRQLVGFSIVFSKKMEFWIGTRERVGFLADTTMALFVKFFRDPEKNMIDYFFRRCDYEEEFANPNNYYVRLFVVIFIEIGHCYDSVVAKILKDESDEQLARAAANSNNDMNVTTTTTEAPSSSTNNIPLVFDFNLSKNLTTTLAVFSLIKVIGSFFYLIFKQAETDWRAEQENQLLTGDENVDEEERTSTVFLKKSR